GQRRCYWRSGYSARARVLMFVMEIRVGGGRLEERRGPAEDVADGVTGELGLVGVVSRPLPCSSAGRKRGESRLGQRLPDPGRDAILVTAGTVGRRDDEVRGIELMPHLVAHEPQSGQGCLDQPTLGRGLACQDVVIGAGVV